MTDDDPATAYKTPKDMLCDTRPDDQPLLLLRISSSEISDNVGGLNW